MTARTKTQTTLVRDVMTRDPATLECSDTALEAARVLDENGISGAPVLDARGSVIGVVSKTDLLHRALEGPSGGGSGMSFLDLLSDGLETTASAPEDLGVVEEFMTPDVVTAGPDEPVAVVARRLAAAGVHRAVVLEESGGLIGIVTALDLMRVFPDA